MTPLHITTIRKRPDLLPIVAEWLWREWWEKKGRTLEQTQAIYASCVAETGAPQTFVLLEGERPVGTVTLAREDLDERPDLTPWLAGVFVIPDRRGRGSVYSLFTEFERACQAASVGVAWLYTNTAERIYLRAGWKTVEVIQRPGKLPITLMRRIIPDERSPANSSAIGTTPTLPPPLLPHSAASLPGRLPEREGGAESPSHLGSGLG